MKFITIFTLIIVTLSLFSSVYLRKINKKRNSGSLLMDINKLLKLSSDIRKEKLTHNIVNKVYEKYSEHKTCKEFTSEFKAYLEPKNYYVKNKDIKNIFKLVCDKIEETKEDKDKEDEDEVSADGPKSDYLSDA